MKTIAIDIDDVISPHAESFVKFHNKYYNTKLSLDEIMQPGEYWGYWGRTLSRELGLSEKESNKRFLSFVAHDSHRKQQPITEETKRYLKRLKENYKLEVITARDQSMRNETVSWLHESLPDLFKEVHFVTSGNRAIAKAEICKKIGAEFIIDDSVEHCNTAAEAGIKAILFGCYGWNCHQEIHDGVTRIKTWQEVIRYFEKDIDKNNPSAIIDSRDGDGSLTIFPTDKALSGPKGRKRSRSNQGLGTMLVEKTML